MRFVLTSAQTKTLMGALKWARAEEQYYQWVNEDMEIAELVSVLEVQIREETNG